MEKFLFYSPPIFLKICHSVKGDYTATSELHAGLWPHILLLPQQDLLQNQSLIQQQYDQVKFKSFFKMISGLIRNTVKYTILFQVGTIFLRRISHYEPFLFSTSEIPLTPFKEFFEYLHDHMQLHVGWKQFTTLETKQISLIQSHKM